MCPKNTAADCLSCQEDAYGYHHISGCNLCECHVNGTINGEKSCDQQDGHCACKENITGRKCDQCLPGKFKTFIILALFISLLVSNKLYVYMYETTFYEVTNIF